MGNSKVSVIIPTHNRANMVEMCIRSVLDTKYSDLEVIVVDDCSSDYTKQMIETFFTKDNRVRYIRNNQNLFQAVSRNRGASIAQGQYLFFLDDDNVVENEIITELLKAFDRNPKAGLIAPVSIHTKNNRVWTLGSKFNKWTSKPNDYYPNIKAEELSRFRNVDYETHYSPNAFMVKREAFDKVGGMDEEMICIFEESDFGYRIKESGYEEYICTKAITHHYGCVGVGENEELRGYGIENPIRTYYFARNRMVFAKRHFNVFQFLTIALIFAPLSVLWYGKVALRNKRFDIAKAYAKGTICGILGIK